jgi:hypothetical protein
MIIGDAGKNYFWGKAGVQINALLAGNIWKNSRIIFCRLFFGCFPRHIFIESLDELALLKD